MKRLRSAIGTGILVLVPLMVTINILVWFVSSVDEATKKYLPPVLKSIDIPGLGVLLALSIIFIIGLFAQNLFGKWMVDWFENFLRKLPIIGGLYGGIRKFMETILNPKSDQFKGTVLVKFPHSGIYSVGFRTGLPDAKLLGSDRKNLVNVFVPCTPNPTSGFYLLVPESDLIPLDLSVQEAFKIVVSMGLVTSNEGAGQSK